jgi:D-alanyl-lipoteichoic acid acyltransferase DltB (MBOAT superfamily)
MSFLSFEFALFLGSALLSFHVVKARWKAGVLLAFSIAFYLSWSVWHTVLLALVTTGVYATALRIEGWRSEGGKRALAALGVMSLLVLMFGFKSAWWFVKEVSDADGAAAVNAVLFVAVPLGLSYYTFKMIGYLLDVYWETLPAHRNLIAVALYGVFFPQIVSGPIQRADSFFQQFDKMQFPDPDSFAVGLKRILLGLGKKIIIADNIGILVGNVHASPAEFSALELLLGAYCYAIQLYTDFSGLTDIAIGIGLLFGFKGPENFDLPYLSANIQQFWRRWHMSLTSWLTDYLFTPLRLAVRKWGTTGLYLAVFINTTAIGLWHGVTWTFFTFGVLHGILVIVSVQTIKRRNLFFQDRPILSRLRIVTAPLMTFHLVVFSMIFFRAQTFQSALEYFAGLAGARGNAISFWRFDSDRVGLSAVEIALYAAALIVIEIVAWGVRRRSWGNAFQGKIHPYFRRIAYAAVIVAVLLMFRGKATFIYAGF